MQTIRFVQKTAADGTLSLEIPLGQPEMECEVLVVVTPRNGTHPSHDRAWPEGYFDLEGSVPDDSFRDWQQP